MKCIIFLVHTPHNAISVSFTSVTAHLSQSFLLEIELLVSIKGSLLLGFTWRTYIQRAHSLVIYQVNFSFPVVKKLLLKKRKCPNIYMWVSLMFPNKTSLELAWEKVRIHCLCIRNVEILTYLRKSIQLFFNDRIKQDQLFTIWNKFYINIKWIYILKRFPSLSNFNVVLTNNIIKNLYFVVDVSMHYHWKLNVFL